MNEHHDSSISETVDHAPSSTSVIPSPTPLSGDASKSQPAPIQRIPPKTKKRSVFKYGLCIAVILLVLLCAFCITIVITVYRSPNVSEDSFRAWVVEHLPLPVSIARVSGDWDASSLRDYEANIAAAQHFFDKQEEFGLALAARPSLGVLYEQEYDRQIDIMVMYKIAADNNITVTAEDVDAYFKETILPQAQSEQEVMDTLKDLYDWTIDDFKKYILSVVVLQNAIKEQVLSSEAADAKARQYAEEVLTEVQKNEKPFSEIAAEYSDDTGSAQDGGALSPFERGVMVKEFEDAAFALQIGEVSGLVKTEYGYHIIKMINRDDAAGTVEVRHILIAFETIEDRIAELKKETKVYKFLPLYPTEETQESIDNPYTSDEDNVLPANTNSGADEVTNSNTNQ